MLIQDVLSEMASGQPGVPNKLEKSICVPTQVIQFLGFLIDSVENVIHLPQEKIQKSALSP